MPKLDLSQIERVTGSIYPAPYQDSMDGRSSLRVGDFGELTQFGANIVRLEAGAKSSLRHFHMKQDEIVIITKGSCTLIDDKGKHPMNTGDVATFPAGDENGHHFVNETDQAAEFFVVGTRTPTETAYYSDIDMMVNVEQKSFAFTKKDGTPLDGENK